MEISGFFNALDDTDEPHFCMNVPDAPLTFGRGGNQRLQRTSEWSGKMGHANGYCGAGSISMATLAVIQHGLTEGTSWVVTRDTQVRVSNHALVSVLSMGFLLKRRGNWRRRLPVRNVWLTRGRRFQPLRSIS